MLQCIKPQNYYLHNFIMFSFTFTVLIFCTLFVLLSDLPSVPGPIVPIRSTDSSVVVTWGASKEVKNLVGYYIEVSANGSGVWVPCNNKPVKGTRYTHQKTEVFMFSYYVVNLSQSLS